MTDDPEVRALRTLLEAVQSSVTHGFDRVDKRLDLLVTRAEFAATVERLDGQHRSLQERVASAAATARWAVGLGVSVAGLAVTLGLFQWLGR